MRKFILIIAAVLCYSPFLMAWDYVCQGEGVEFKFSRSSKDAILIVDNQKIHICLLDEEIDQGGFSLSGLLNHTKYRDLLIYIPNKFEFETLLKLDTHIKKITCTFYTPISL